MQLLYNTLIKIGIIVITTLYHLQKFLKIVVLMIKKITRGIKYVF